MNGQTYKIFHCFFYKTKEVTHIVEENEDIKEVKEILNDKKV